MRLNRVLGFIAEPIFALIIGGALIAGASWSPVEAQEEEFAPQAVIGYADAPEAEIRAAAATFVWAVSNGAADAVWNFALEEEQQSFGTAEIAFEAVAEAYPPLVYAAELTFDGIRMEDGLPTASYYVKDRVGLQWRASFGIIQDDAGDWKIVSLKLEAAPGKLV